MLGEVIFTNFSCPRHPLPHCLDRHPQIGCDVVMEDCSEIITCKGGGCGGRKKSKDEDKPSKKKDKEKKSGGWFGGGGGDDDD